MKIVHLIPAAAAIAIAIMPSMAQDSSGLPGGASSLREEFGSWTVFCQQPQEGDAFCNMQQQQAREDGRRVLTIELQPQPEGKTAKALFIMPFGLALSDGLSLKIEEQEKSPSLPFRTCLPQGCLVESTLGADIIAAMKANDQIELITTADNSEQKLAFSVSLNGFTAAFERTKTLLDR